MANSKTSENAHQRVKLLREYGCSRVRDAEGSHSIWTDATGQKFTLCESPASGTWEKIKKQARDADKLRKKQEQSRMIALKAAQAAKEDKEKRRKERRQEQDRRKEVNWLCRQFTNSAGKVNKTKVMEAMKELGLERRHGLERRNRSK